MDFSTLDVSLDGHVATIALNRPDKANAMSEPMWYEIEQAMQWLDETPEARVGVLVGRGKYFTSGIDLALLMGVPAKIEDEDEARKREKLRRLILRLQDTLTSVERCRKPVLAAVHGACIGGGIDLVTACDMRYCSADAWFSVREIDVGMTADVGTLQRLPGLIGEGMARELAYTGRRVDGAEAKEMRLVNRCYESAEALHEFLTGSEPGPVTVKEGNHFSWAAFAFGGITSSSSSEVKKCTSGLSEAFPGTMSGR